MPIQRPEAVAALIKYLEKHGQDRSWRELTEKFHPTAHANWARAVATNKGWDFNANAFTVQKKVQETKHIKALQKHKTESSRLTDRVIELEKEISQLTRIKQYSPKRFHIPAPTTDKKREATAIVQYSDWHVDEVVEAEVVNGLNAYNPDIAKARATNLFQNTVKLVNSQRSAIGIKRLVIHYGGDFSGGYIHPELMQTNSMSPIQGIFFSKELTINGTDYLLKYGDFDEIVFVCSRGNHTRLTPKMQYANDYSMNLETFLFHSLADHYQQEKRISFQIDKSELSYMNIYGRELRFFHGWQVKSQGGIGGIGIPLYKAIHRWNGVRPAYYNFMCDKHTYSNPTPDCQLNGSMKGYDAMAASHGFSYQPPIQSFTLLDSKRGITVKAPIYCD